MADAGNGTRPLVLLLSIGAFVAAALLVWSTRVERSPAPVSAPGPVSAARPPAAGAAPTPLVAAPETPDAAAPDPEADPSEGVFDASALAWSRVDMDAVRAALPDNGYWERSMPTSDPARIREREEERAYWNAQYGKVLSNTASEAEVRDYYAHRQRISTDAVEFSDYLLGHYADVLTERDVGLLELARRLHLARLEELPRNLGDALARRDAHERARREWLAQQELFEAAEPPSPEAD